MKSPLIAKCSLLLLVAATPANVEVVKTSMNTQLLALLAVLVSITSLTFIGVLLLIGVRKPLF